jgi:hypothetical protein
VEVLQEFRVCVETATFDDVGGNGTRTALKLAAEAILFVLGKRRGRPINASVSACDFSHTLSFL